MTPSRSAEAFATWLADLDQRAGEIAALHPADARADAVYGRAIAAIDRARHKALQDYIRSDVMARDAAAPGTLPLARGPYKYFDLPYHLRVKAFNAVELDLDRGPSLSILDLGCGGGHFAHVAQALGHRALGIDLEFPEYGRMLDCFGVTRVIHRITPDAPLPLDGHFDLVTAFEVTFNNREAPHLPPSAATVLWREQDWRVFIEGLFPLLKPGGRIFLRLNRQRIPETGEEHAGALLDMFADWGATIERAKVQALFTRPPR